MKKILLTAILLGTSTLSGWATETEEIKEDSMTINMRELTVKGTAPKTRVKGDAMRTIVNGSVLEQTTTATEMLKYIPNVEAESGSVSVIGRGASEVYINGRKIQDLKELDQNRPEQIQYVDVVANPGARYSASTRSVIRITMMPMPPSTELANCALTSTSTVRSTPTLSIASTLRRASTRAQVPAKRKRQE